MGHLGKIIEVRKRTFVPISQKGAWVKSLYLADNHKGSFNFGEGVDGSFQPNISVGPRGGWVPGLKSQRFAYVPQWECLFHFHFQFQSYLNL